MKTLLLALDLAGTFVFALSGAMIAVKHQPSLRADSFRNSANGWWRRNGRALAVAMAVSAFCFGLGGCATDGYVNVSTYPNYAPYYGYYGYGGAPYYGYGGIYTHNIVVRGRRHSGSFGRHHFTRHRRGGDRSRFSRPDGMRRSPGIRRNRGGGRR